MIRNVLLSAFFCLLLSACVGAPNVSYTPTAMMLVGTESLQKPTATARATRTPRPTNTLYPTWTPFYPTLTPNSLTLAAIPIPNTECPPKNPSLTPNFNLSLGEILDYLNKGGDVSAVINKARTNHQLAVQEIRYQDVNGDTIPEIIFINATANNSIGQLVILSCRNNSFVSNLPYSGAPSPINLFAIIDINKNGTPEIVITYRGCSGSGCFGFYTYEWDGQNFKNNTLLAEEIFGLKSINFQDIDGNGVDEILLAGDQPGSCCASDEIAWRLKTVVYTWNGTVFSKNYFYFAPPQYRFQVVQDGDRETDFGHYSKAFTAYQEAIFNDKLDWWSEDKFDYLLSAYLGGGHHEPIGPAPFLDRSEYPHLAAYAYYRMIILHTQLGEMEAAQIKYATLQEKFPADSPGYPYVEMATDFWNAYQSSGLMYDACAAAIAFAEAHPEILIPLGSDYHGAQSRWYQPAGVCPFR